MKGTEKQVSWAEDIKVTVINTIDAMLAATANDPRANSDAAKAIRAKFQRAREAVEACEIAADLIEVYGRSVSSRNADQANMKAVSAAIANRFKTQYGTASQRALIGE